VKQYVHYKFYIFNFFLYCLLRLWIFNFLENKSTWNRSSEWRKLDIVCISYTVYDIVFMKKRLTNNDINWKWKSQNYYSACSEGFNFFKGSDLIHNWTTTGEGFQLSTKFITLWLSSRLDNQNISYTMDWLQAVTEGFYA